MSILVNATQEVSGLQLAGGVTGGAFLKWWNGAERVLKPLKRWNGSAWVQDPSVPLKYYDFVLEEWVTSGGAAGGGVVTDSLAIQLQTDVTATDTESSISIDIKDNVSIGSALVELLDITLRVTPADGQSVSGVDVAQHITEDETVQLQTDVTATDTESSISASVQGNVTGSAEVTLS